MSSQYNKILKQKSQCIAARLLALRFLVLDQFALRFLVLDLQ